MNAVVSSSGSTSSVANVTRLLPSSLLRRVIPKEKHTVSPSSHNNSLRGDSKETPANLEKMHVEKGGSVIPKPKEKPSEKSISIPKSLLAIGEYLGGSYQMMGKTALKELLNPKNIHVFQDFDTAEKLLEAIHLTSPKQSLLSHLSAKESDISKLAKKLGCSKKAAKTLAYLNAIKGGKTALEHVYQQKEHITAAIKASDGEGQKNHIQTLLDHLLDEDIANFGRAYEKATDTITKRTLKNRYVQASAFLSLTALADGSLFFSPGEAADLVLKKLTESKEH